MKNLLASVVLLLVFYSEAYAVSWSSTPPSSISAGQAYGLGAHHTTGSSTVYVYIFKNGTMVASNSGSYGVGVSYNSPGDSGGQTITYRAEGHSYNPGSGLDSSITAYTTVVAPNPIITGITTNIGTVIRSGNVFKPRVSATAGISLYSIHIYTGPPVADYNSLTNAQAFGAVSGTSATMDGNPITAGAPGTTYTFYARCETTAPTTYSPSYGPVTFTVVNTPPDAALDTVSYSNGWISGNGWAADPDNGAPVNRFEVFLDGVYKQNASLGGDRVDVSNAYGRSDYRYSGTNFSFNAAGVAVGNHTVLARAYDNNGGYTDRANTVNVTNIAPTVSMTINGVTSTGGTANGTTVNNGTTITISTSASDADGNLQRIRVWANYNSQGWTEIRNATAASDSFGYALTGFGTYEVHCRSMDTQGVESSTAVINVTSANRAPDLSTIANGGVTTIALGSSVSLTGTLRDLDGNLAYHSLWYLPPGGSWTLVPGAPIAPSNAANSTVNGLFSPTSVGTWQFKTNGHDGSLWGPDAILSVAVYDGTRPSTPVGLTSSAITSTGFTLSWNPSSDDVGVTEYEVMKDTTSLGTTAATSMAINGLAPGSAYSVKVRARDAANNWSDWSSSLSVTTLPNPPSAAAATNIAGTSFTANWSAAGGATSYRLDVSTVSTFASYVTGYQDLDVGNVTSWSVTGLATNTTYYYRVRAVNAGGASGNSSTITSTTLPSPPVVPIAAAATNIEGASFTANWSGAGGATSYRLDVSTVSTFASYVTGFQDLDVGNVTSWSVVGLATGTAYYYRVRAVNTGGTSGSSATIALTTSPGAPTATAATAIAGTSFTANWSAAGGATSYRLDVSTVSTFVSYVSGYQNLDVGNATSWSVTGLATNTTYYYRVRTVNAGGTSGNSSTITVTTLPSPPTAPVATAATAITGTSFTANWSAAGGATSYRLDVSTVSTFASFVSGYQNLDVGNVTTRSITGLATGKTYYYRVRAVNAGGTSGNSATINLTLIPGVPTAAAATSIAGTSFTANWAAAGGATSYRLDVSTVSTFAGFVSGCQNLDVGNVTNRSVTGLMTNTTYYYRVRAVNATGTSGNSSAIILTTAPSAPVAASATVIAGTSFTANWAATGGATSYRLDVSTVSTFASFVSGYQNLDVGNVTSRSVTGLTTGTTYYYRVRAVNIGGASGNSATITLATLPGPPSAPVATAATVIAGTSFTANWSASGGATSYRLDVSTVSTFATFVGGYQDLDVGNVTSCSVTGLTTNTTYYYRVRAVNANGTSGNSSTITLTTAPSAPIAAPATVIATTSFAANWSAAGGATSYRLDVSTVSTFASYVTGYQDLAVGNVTSRSVTSLTTGTTYYYRVRAVNANGTSGNSATINVTLIPGVPTAAAATSTAGTSFTANWAATGGATSYRLDVSTVSTFASYVTGYQNLDVGNTTSRSVTGLTTGTTYYYRVRAVNASGTSGNSANTMITTLPSAPTGAAATAIVGTSFTANWGAVSGATSYLLDVSTSNTFASFVTGYQNLNVGNVTSRSVSGLITNTAYYYRVRALNTGGTSPSSSTITLTVTKAPASVTLANLSQSYTGAPRHATAETLPTGKTVSFTYEGSPTAPTDAGSYAVIGTINDPDYAGSSNGTMVINKINQSALTVVASTTQTMGVNQTLGSSGGSGEGAVTYTIVGQSVAGAGSIAGDILTANVGTGWVDIQATKAIDTNYNAATSVSKRVNFAKAPATVTFGSLSQTYDGTAKVVSVTTTPVGLMTTVTYNGSATLPINAGPYTLLATINDSNYTGTASGTLTVDPAPQTVTVSPASPRILFGESVTLSASGAQNGYAWGGAASGAAASSTVSPSTAGAFSAIAYSPAGGNYARSNDVTVAITVDKATPSGNFAGKTVQAPYTLSAADLTASFVHPFNNSVTAPTGTVTYSPAAGSQLNAGSHAVTATYPGDGNYNSVSITATFVVNKTTPTIVWNPANIAYGAAYGSAQLNATASVPGTYDYTPASGARAFPLGSKVLSVTFTPNDSVNYYAAGATANITVTKATQSINFNPTSPITYGVKPYSLGATATSGLPVTYSVSPSSLASVSGGILTVKGAGDITVTASQDGDENYYSADVAVRTIHVNRASQTITFPDPALSNYILKAWSTSGLPINYSSNNVTMASIGSLPSSDPNIPPLQYVQFNGNSNLIGSAITIKAEQPGNDNYLPADPKPTWDINLQAGNKWLSRPPDVFATSNTQFQLRYYAYSTSSNVTLCYRKAPASTWTICGSGGNGGGGGGFVASGGVTFSQSGTYYIAAMDGPDQNSPIISGSQVTLTVVSEQSITFQPIANNRPQVGDQIPLYATASSGLPVTFEVESGPATIVNGSTLSVNGWGPITVRAKQAGNSQYAAALNATQTIVAIRPPMLNVDNFTNPTASNPVLTASGWALDAQDGAPITVQFYVNGAVVPGVVTNGLPRPEIQTQSVANGWSSKDVTACGWSLSFDTRTIPTGSSSYIRASNSLGGLVDWTTGSFTGQVGLGTQTITFAPIPNKQVGDPDFPLSATSNRGLGISYTIVSGPATIVAGTPNIVHLGASNGMVTVQASNPGVPGSIAPATATTTFMLGFVDTNSNLVDDAWEIKYGLSLVPSMVNNVAPNGYTYLENFNAWNDPNVTIALGGGGSGAIIPIEINVVGKPTGSTGSVTVTLNGITSTFGFQGGTANTWQGPYSVDRTAFTAELGRPAALIVSSTGMTDFVIVSKTSPDVAPSLHIISEFGGTSTSIAYLESLSKAELQNLGSSPTLTVRREGSAPFGELDTSRFETSRMLTFGLGSSSSGQTPGVLTSGGTNGIGFIKGPGTINVWQSKPTRTQIQVPAGYVDLVRTRTLTTLSYYANGSYPGPDSSGYKDFSAAAPLITYSISGLLGGSSGTVSRTVGGVTTFLEYEFASSESVVGPVRFPETGPFHHWATVTTTTKSMRMWGWRTSTAARSGLIVSQNKSQQEVDGYYEPNPSQALQPAIDGTIQQTITRYLGSTTNSTIGSTEYRTYYPGDTALVNSVSVQRGGTNEPSEGRWATPSALRLSLIQTANGKGGGTVTENYSLAKNWWDPNNLGSQPTFVIGEPKTIRQSFGNGTTATTDTALVSTYLYRTDGLIDGKVAPDTITTTQGSAQIGGASYLYGTGSVGGIPTIKTTVTSSAKAGSSVQKIVTNFSRRILDLDRRGKPVSVINPDNTQVSYAYQRGTLNAAGTWIASVNGPDLLVAELNGAKASGTPSLNVSTYPNSTSAIDPVLMDPNKSTVQERVFNSQGRLKREATFVYTGTGFIALNSVTYEFDDLGNLKKKTDASGRILYEANYTGFRKNWEADESGITLSYTYDNYDRVATMTRAGATSNGNTITAITTTYGYDLLGRLKTETVSAAGTTETLITSYEFDIANRPSSRTAPGGFTTTILYAPPSTSVGLIESTTLPGAGTKVTQYLKDGRVASVTGSSVPDVTYSYSYDSTTGNLKTTQTTAGQSVTTEADWLGRTLNASTATFGGGTRVVSNSYNDRGLLERQETRLGAVQIAPARVFNYDDYGRLKFEGLKTGTGETVNPATDYDVKEYLFEFKTGAPGYATNLYRYEAVKIWPLATTTTSRFASETFTQVTGLGSTTVAHIVSLDFDRNKTDTTSIVDRSNKKLTVSTTADGTTQTLQQVTLNGLPIKSTNAQGQTTLQTYDPLGRLEASDYPRIGTTDFVYHTGAALVKSGTAPDGKTTAYEYDGAGRVKSQTNPDNKTAYFQYDDAGNLTHQWGDTVNPVKFVYNELGQKIEMYTYQAGTFPADFATDGVKTTWNYQPATGLLISKKDAVNPVTSYEYNDLGQVKQRTDSRSWVTKYEYDNPFKLLSKVDYTGTAETFTNDLVYDYDRAGRMKSVDQTGVGMRTFGYYDTGTGEEDTDLLNKSARLKTETLPAYLGSHVLTYDYSYGVAGRANGAATGVKLGTGSLYTVAYGYDAVLRLNSVTYNGGAPVNYGYVADSNLIDTVTQGATAYLRDYDHESNSNRLATLKHGWGTDTLKAVESRLTYDQLGLRNTEKTQGTSLMAALGRTGVHTDYTYNARAELDDSGKYQLPGWGVGGVIAGTIRAYEYDAIGNRTSDQNGTYTPNSLNQYEAAPAFGTFSYDANGNLKGDGVRLYDYDAENRLIKVTQGGSIWNYVYDYLGRRIAKSGTGLTETRFIYDGWNLIAETDATGTIGRRFAWGLDVSGSLQGAGGVGGLLTIDTGSIQYRPIYDASHNVIGLYDGVGAIAAAYEYDPFGNVQTIAGSYSLTNPFRSATKYTDAETGMVYYGHRYYSPQLGRFLNRDPIEESGGPNLYGFCGNDGVNRYDYLGMNWFIDAVSSIGNAISGFFGKNDSNDLPTSGDTLTLPGITVSPGEGDSNVSKPGKDYNPGIEVGEHGREMLEDYKRETLYDGPAWWGTNFVGPTNAPWDSPPKNLADSAALNHDRAYDKLGIAGPKGALLSVKAVPADVELIKRTNAVIKSFITRSVDPHTGKTTSLRTAAHAEAIGIAFIAITVVKAPFYAVDRLENVAARLNSPPMTTHPTVYYGPHLSTLFR